MTSLRLPASMLFIALTLLAPEAAQAHITIAPKFSFVARNPRDKADVVWQLRQRFADGTVSDWTKGPNGIRSTSMTTLTPRPAQ